MTTRAMGIHVVDSPSRSQRLPFCTMKVRKNSNAAKKQNAAHEPYLRRGTISQHPHGATERGCTFEFYPAIENWEARANFPSRASFRKTKP